MGTRSIAVPALNSDKRLNRNSQAPLALSPLRTVSWMDVARPKLVDRTVCCSCSSEPR